MKNLYDIIDGEICIYVETLDEEDEKKYKEIMKRICNKVKRRLLKMMSADEVKEFCKVEGK